MPNKTKLIRGKWRVVESATGKITKKNGKAVDGGGHKDRAAAIAQATAINYRQGYIK